MPSIFLQNYHVRPQYLACSVSFAVCVSRGWRVKPPDNRGASALIRTAAVPEAGRLQGGSLWV